MMMMIYGNDFLKEFIGNGFTKEMYRIKFNYRNELESLLQYEYIGKSFTIEMHWKGFLW